MFRLVVDARQKDIFQSDFPTGSIKPCGTGIKKIIDGAVGRPRDEFSA